MTDHEGDIANNDRKLSHPMQPLDDPDEIFELASITAVACDEAIDTNILESRVSKTVQDYDKLRRYDMNADFGDRLSLRGEISKCSASIRSTIAQDTEFSLFTKHITTTMDELEHPLSSILDPDQGNAVIATVSAN